MMIGIGTPISQSRMPFMSFSTGWVGHRRKRASVMEVPQRTADATPHSGAVAPASQARVSSSRSGPIRRITSPW